MFKEHREPHLKSNLPRVFKEHREPHLKSNFRFSTCFEASNKFIFVFVLIFSKEIFRRLHAWCSQRENDIRLLLCSVYIVCIFVFYCVLSTLCAYSSSTVFCLHCVHIHLLLCSVYIVCIFDFL